MRRAIVVFTGGLATVAMSLAITINAAPVRALELLPGQFECGGQGTAGELPVGAFSLSGTVTNGGGAGIGDIRVKVQELVAGAPFGARDAFTGSNGTWSLDGLGDAVYIVSFSDESEAYRNGWYNSLDGLVIGSENASSITISGASEANIDVTLPNEAPLILSGKVTAPGGAGVEGILVTASDRDFGISGCAYTDASGDWAMRIRTGRYIVRVDDFSGTFLSGFYDDSNPLTNFTLSRADATRLDLTGDVANIDVQFPPTYTLEGTVTDGVNPLEGLSVQGCVDGDNCVVFADTDASGQYILSAVADGDWTIRIGDGSNTYRSGFRGPGDGVVADVAQAATTNVSGENVTGVNVSTFLNATMSGTVTGTGGPLAGVDVQVCNDETGDCGYGTTDAFGAYVTGGLPPNAYTVRVSDPTGDHPSGYLTAGPGFSQLPGDATTVAVGDLDVTGIDVDVPDGYRISGTLLVNGAPAEGRSVGVCPIEEWCVTETSTEFDGSFLTPAVLPGTYRLQTFTNDRVFYLEGADAILSFDGATGVLVAADVSGITFQVFEPPPGAETPVGTNVPVFPEDPNTGQAPVALTFDNVTAEGVTSLSISDQGPETPAGFQLGDPPTWFDISTTATFAGNVEVCIYYGAVFFPDESNLRLLHYKDSADPPEWVNVTTSLDVDNDTICGLTDGFSFFTVAAATPTFGGFEAPVDELPVANTAKAGSSIPVKFSLGGDFGLGILAGGSPSSVTTDCVASEVDAIETVAAGSSSLSYDAVTGLYTYVWKTSKQWGGTCRTLIIEFADGSRERAAFNFSR